MDFEITKQREWELREDVEDTIFLPYGYDLSIIYCLYIDKVIDELAK